MSPPSVTTRALSYFIRADSPLLPLARHYAWTVPVVVIAGLLATILEGLGIGLAIPMLSLLSGSPTGGSGLVGWLSSIPNLLPEPYRYPGMAAFILGCVIVKGVIQSTTGMLISHVEVRGGHDIRQGIAKRLIETGYPFFLENSQARLFNAIGTDSWRVSDGIRSVFTLVGGSATVAVYAIILLLVNWKLFVITSLGSLVIGYLQSRTRERANSVSDAMQLANVDLADRMMILTYNFGKLIRLFGQQKEEESKFCAASGKVSDELLKLYAIRSINAPLIEVAYSGLFLIVLLAALPLGVEVPVLVAFLVLMYRMQPHVQSVGAAAVELAAIRGSLREVEWLLNAPSPTDDTGGLAFRELNEGIAFAGVRFEFDKRSVEPAVRDLTFTIRAGEWTALRGASGAGKSTIVNLLCRFLKPTAGRITVDGVDLQDFAKASWRAGLGVAGQDLEIFEGTIAENISYGSSATSEEIAAAAHTTCIDELIASLPDGYQTRIGERGYALSGGQRQRIGLARALIRRPRLLILDEATNALDAKLEAEVMRRLRTALPGATVIVISHRAATIRDCDYTVSLENGMLKDETA